MTYNLEDCAALRRVTEFIYAAVAAVETALRPHSGGEGKGKPLTKLGALSDHQRLIRQRGVAPLIYQYGAKVITPRERQAREARRGALPTHL